MIQPLPAGRTRLIGPYQLLGLLGAGGMGEVYLARPVDGPQAPGPVLVALKTVRPDLDLDDGFRVRFRREIAAAEAVRSPHTAALVGGDASGRLPWLATEYVPGPSLAEAVARGGPLPEPAVRALGAGLALALADMHAVRVLHRDLKPGNVLLGPDGPKVIDFGIAQAFDATQLTRTGVVVGSPGYISPEHVNGSRALVPASDVFCLGAVLAFAATGHGPFDDSDMAAVIFRIARGESELSRVPPTLRPVIEACLRTDPAARPAPGRLAELLLPRRPAPGAFPWTDAVREQLAAHAAAAGAWARAAAPAPAAPPLPPHHPAFARTPVVPVAVPGDRKGGGGRLRLGLAALATAACVALGAVLLPGLLSGDDGQDGTGGAARPTASASGAVSTEGAGQVVFPHADPGRTGDFGAVAADVSARPEGWRAWHAQVDDGRVECVYAGASLVCAGPRRITALAAADGKRLWRGARTDSGPTSVAAVLDGTVYAFEGGALVARGLSEGAEKWREPLPDGVAVADSVQSGDTLYYATKARGSGTGRLVARRLTGDHDRVWDKEWRDTSETAELLLDDGRLVAAGDAVTVLKASDGTRVSAAGTRCRTPVLKGGQLLCPGPDGLTVVDVTSLGKRRTLLPGVDIAFRPALAADGTVVVGGTDRVYGVDLGSGETRWATCACEESMAQWGAPYVVGDRAMIVQDYGPTVVPLASEGEVEPRGAAEIKGWPGPAVDDYPDPASVSVLARGDTVLASFENGTVLSAYAP
ncbi:serine/threonine-protein kinase [Streptomyces sp. 130]|uniref:serine/threonine-protein kinase n=1 Tax=Streptomyces sp. 130 TaxID=2591006 RepID=UPI00117F1F79|nr:serine/threonine-protein kinase [Streptomyces sp. 130]TRV78554.1 serine/threonine-protein kinase [Streptomyces sp. 130]